MKLQNHYHNNDNITIESNNHTCDEYTEYLSIETGEEHHEHEAEHSSGHGKHDEHADHNHEHHEHAEPGHAHRDHHDGHGHHDHHEHDGHGHCHEHGLFGHHHHEHENFGEAELQDSSLRRVLYISIGLNLAYSAAEALLGFKFNSLGLVSDAGHNLSDVFSLVLSLLAVFLAAVSSSHRYTYGLKKTTVLISLVNAIILLAAVAGIIFESAGRIVNPQPVEGLAAAWTAGAGIFVNGLTVWLLSRFRKDDLNAAGAFWHMFADTLVSVGVVISGLIIHFTGINMIDTAVSIIVALIILASSWNFMRDSIKLAIDGVPSGLDIDEITEKCGAVEGVCGVHHVHVWAISTKHNAMTAHIVLEKGRSWSTVKKAVREVLQGLSIHHATLEPEEDGEECAASDCAGLH